MSLKVKWQRPAQPSCSLCGTDMPDCSKQKLDLKRCLLCGYAEGQSLCQDCLLPCSSSWPLPDNLPAHAPVDKLRDGFVCLQCVSDEEYGLCVRAELSKQQLKQLSEVEWQAFKQGGFPGPEIVQISTLTLPPVREK